MDDKKVIITNNNDTRDEEVLKKQLVESVITKMKEEPKEQTKKDSYVIKAAKRKPGGLFILYKVLRETHMLPTLVGFIIYFFIMGTLIFFFANSQITGGQSNINNYGDALWYSFASVFTIGYGDVWMSSTLGRILTVLLVIYGVYIVALIPGIFTAFFQEKMQEKITVTSTEIEDKLGRLDTLTKEELKELSDTLKHIKKKKEELLTKNELKKKYGKK